MIPAEEIAAIVAALSALAPQDEPPQMQARANPQARWKAAARRPELELEEIRAIF